MNAGGSRWAALRLSDQSTLTHSWVVPVVGNVITRVFPSSLTAMTPCTWEVAPSALLPHQVLEGVLVVAGLY